MTCNSTAAAIQLLERLPPSPSSVFWWNQLIRRALHLGTPRQVFALFLRMKSLGWTPDHYTFPFVFKVCPFLSLGASLHATVARSGFASNVFVSNALVSMYGKCGALTHAQHVFDDLCQQGVQDLVSWNSIVSAYMGACDLKTSLLLFRKMTRVNLMSPDVISLVNVLPACGSLAALLHGREVHGFAIRSGLGHALSLFERMREEDIELDVVTWTAVITGYAQRGQGCEALDVFRQMCSCCSRPNAVTLVSLLSACASVGALLHGKETHCYAIKFILGLDGPDPGDDDLKSVKYDGNDSGAACVYKKME
ncbi:Pentatricopeptide repeat-containing protein [Vigna angularis]|uniref:Pentatricopeptide repeat-containing protein n=1 Tax=Phaseolus angularis TaxID=3914 RepID=A0A8T0K4D0_PHAAN|nr:Pentatricopeptide repeat-containing protein [Vigna angularis]